MIDVFFSWMIVKFPILISPPTGSESLNRMEDVDPLLSSLFSFENVKLVLTEGSEFPFTLDTNKKTLKVDRLINDLLKGKYHEGIFVLCKLASQFLHDYMKNDYRDAYCSLVRGICNLGESEHKSLEKLLIETQLDYQGHFLRFMRKATSIDIEDQNSILKLSRWLEAQITRRYPYDVARARDILDSYRDERYTNECRRALYNLLKETYNESLDEHNIRKLVEEARRNGAKVVYMRLSRAAMVLGYLLAASKVVKIDRDLKNAVEDLMEKSRKIGLIPSVMRLQRLVSREEVPEAEFERAVNLVFQELEEYRKTALKNGHTPMEVYSFLADYTNSLLKISEFLNKTEKKPGALLIFGQRISPGGASRIVYINEGLPAYAGPSFGLERYIDEANGMVYVTPTLKALKYVDYWIEALPLFIHETEEGKYEIDYQNFEEAIRNMAEYWAENIEDSIKTGRSRPTFNVLTTQSFNMTNLVKHWLEEEMANYNIIKHYELEDEVNTLVQKYSERVSRAIWKLAEIYGFSHELKSLGDDPIKSAIKYVRMHPEIELEVGCIALIIEHNLLKKYEDMVNSGISPKDALLKIIDETKIGDTSLIEEARGYFRRYTALAKSTARKEVIMKHNLLNEVEKFRYEATGLHKHYNLAYTPSRVDLGPHEIESVNMLGQPVGPYDEEAAKATVNLFKLVNKSIEGVYTYDSPSGAEGQKTLENASRDDNYAFSNLVALASEAMGTNAYTIVSNISMRPTHLLLWPGKGYGGFCVPKDGLFVSYVLQLRDREILEKLGVPPKVWHKVIELVDHALSIRPEYEDQVEWQLTLREKLREIHPSLDTYLPSIDRVASILSSFRGYDEWSRHLKDLAFRAYEARYLPSRAVNILMAYHSAEQIYHVIDLARRINPRLPDEGSLSIGIQAAYKPNVQDSRLSTEFDVFLALVKDDTRLRRIRWKWIKELVWSFLEKRRVPGELRIVDPLIERDDFMFDSSLRLRDLAHKVMALLEKYGFDEDDVRENIRTYGLNVWEWRTLSEDRVEDSSPQLLIDLIKLRDEYFSVSNYRELLTNPVLREVLRGIILTLHVYLDGFYSDIVEGIKGLDVLSLGIPHKPFLDLVEDLPRLASLMLYNNQDSCLALVDGTAGARGPVLDKDMVMEWLSLGGVYTCIGISDRAISRWRLKARKIGENLGSLLELLLSKKFKEADEKLQSIISKLDDSVFEEYVKLLKGSEIGVDMGESEYRRKRYETLLNLVHRAFKGLSLSDLDFATFLALGGRFYLLSIFRNMGSYERFERYVRNVWKNFDESIKAASKFIKPKQGRLNEEEIKRAVEILLLRPERGITKLERVMGGALKGEAMEEWESLQRHIARLRAYKQSLLSTKLKH
ncbi:hypothetical protein DRN93_01800, partial [archaeon]